MQSFDVVLVPSFQVGEVPGMPGYWQASGIDPQFSVTDGKQNCGFPSGHYCVEISNDENMDGFYNPVLFYDAGYGYAEHLKIPLVFHAVGKDVFRAYFVFPTNVVSVRFDPSELNTRMQIRRIRLVSLSRTQWYLSAGRLLINDRKSRGATTAFHLRRAREIISKGGIRGLAAKVRDRIAMPLPSAVPVSSRTHDLQQADWNPSNRSVFDDVSGLRKYYDLYLHESSVAEGYRDPIFAADRATPVDVSSTDVKLLAYYLPQFHPFEQNDQWWGKGFTEWTNVTKAVPRFVGHYQPKLPGDLGFYDLRNVDTMREQAALAKKFGLTGFCFHFYWFGGTRLMETPILNFRAAEDIDFQYSLCWANENWSRRWDGAEDELLIGQRHSPEDDIAFITYVATYFADKRYIKVDGKPMLTIYRPDILPDAKATVKRWHKAAKELGFPGLYLVATNSFGFTDYKKYGFDALSEFPPHAVQADTINSGIAKYDPRYAGGVFSYDSLVHWQKTRADAPAGTVFPGVIPAWDNVARRPLAGHVFHGSTPEAYRDWLIFAMERVRKTNPDEQRFVMINAWNEWAEGAYLEPDRLYGHAYLWATASALESRPANAGKLSELAAEHNKGFKPAGTHAVAVHLFYLDTLEDLRAALEGRCQIDVYMTVPDTVTVDVFTALTKAFPRCFILPVTNCGRDILPFINILSVIMKHPYEWVCKIHSKKSLHLGQGNLWRRELFAMLLDGLKTSDKKQSHALLPKNAKVGMVGPAGSLAELSEPWTLQNNREQMETLQAKCGFGDERPRLSEHSFFAGSMFWFRPKALARLVSAHLTDADFGLELGRIDGTPAHAMERLFGVLAATEGFQLAEMANLKAVSANISMAKRDRK